MPVFVIYGEEPYLLNKRKSDLVSGRDAFFHQEFTQDTVSQLWQDSFFSTNPCGVVELECVKGLNEAFFHYADNANEKAMLVVTIRNMDERTREYKTLLANKGRIQLIRCDKLSGKSYQDFVMRKISAAGKRIRRETFLCLLNRIGYEERSEVTLYTCENMLKNIIAVCDGEEITMAVIDSLYPERSSINKFGVASLIDQRNKAKLFAIAPVLTEEGVIPFLGLLMREYRIAFKAKICPVSEIGVRASRNFCTWDMPELVKAMRIISSVTAFVKEAAMPDSIAIAYTFNQLLEIRSDHYEKKENHERIAEGY